MAPFPTFAGRAGRFASQYPEGEVTRLEPKDLAALKYLLQQPPETITEAGLFPTFDQLQLVATRRPRWSLRQILVSASSLAYYPCDVVWMDDRQWMAVAVHRSCCCWSRVKILEASVLHPSQMVSWSKQAACLASRVQDVSIPSLHDFLERSASLIGRYKDGPHAHLM
jgi:hypothetical protein